MPGEQDGEYISLIWDGWPDIFFVKGHVSPKNALWALEIQEVLERWERDRSGNTIKFLAILSPAIHCFARWSMEPGPDGCSQVIREYKEPGRGRFKVTAFNVLRWQRFHG